MSSLSFIGNSTSYLRIPNTPDFNFGTGDLPLNGINSKRTQMTIREFFKLEHMQVEEFQLVSLSKEALFTIGEIVLLLV